MDDFYYTYDKDAFPDFKKELGFFSRNPLNPNERLTIDMLLQFVIFDEETKVAELENGLIKIMKKEKEIIIIEKNIELACIPDEINLDLPTELLTNKPSHSASLFSYDLTSSKKMKSNKRSSYMEFLSCDLDFGTNKKFNPPDFGVTVLGCSHGFDPKGSTSGYVFWINGRFEINKFK